MYTKSRIKSILSTNNLNDSVTGFPSFDLSALVLTQDLDFELPINLRLGHLAEKVVSKLIKASSNYNLLYKNLQLIEDKQTIGELDFIIEAETTKQITHLELAYKFYLFDPNISSETINNWIGPNRNDSLKEKLEKLKNKQFPLLYHDCTKSILDKIEIEEVSQALCFLVSLFIPYEHKPILNPIYERAIKGYYINHEEFINRNHLDKKYYLPSKLEWGMEPFINHSWFSFKEIKERVENSIDEEQSVLCWEKDGDCYKRFFIVWW